MALGLAQHNPMEKWQIRSTKKTVATEIWIQAYCVPLTYLLNSNIIPLIAFQLWNLDRYTEMCLLLLRVWSTQYKGCQHGQVKQMWISSHNGMNYLLPAVPHKLVSQNFNSSNINIISIWSSLLAFRKVKFSSEADWDICSSQYFGCVEVWIKGRCILIVSQFLQSAPNLMCFACSYIAYHLWWMNWTLTPLRAICVYGQFNGMVKSW